MSNGLCLGRFPTFVFMEFMLPRVFGWPDIFRPETASNPFPSLARWYPLCLCLMLS